MKTNNEIVELFKAQNKAFELLMKTFDLSVEKCGKYENLSSKKNIQKKSFYTNKLV